MLPVSFETRKKSKQQEAILQKKCAQRETSNAHWLDQSKPKKDVGKLAAQAKLKREKKYMLLIKLFHQLVDMAHV